MYKTFIKRFTDITVSVLMLMLLSPLMALIAILIKIGSEGPVFFRQMRGGKGGTAFEMYKFRSMFSNDEAEKKGFEPGSRNRITPTGKILRKTKLDELPQLINVLKGDMSLVGPRPEVMRYIEFYPERWAFVLSIKPGITDPASVKFRNEEDILAASADPEKEYREVILPRKLGIYEDYVRSISFAGDMKIMLDSFIVVVFK